MRLASLVVLLLAAVPLVAAPPVTGPAAGAVELPVSAQALRKIANQLVTVANEARTAGELTQ